MAVQVLALVQDNAAVVNAVVVDVFLNHKCEELCYRVSECSYIAQSPY